MLIGKSVSYCVKEIMTGKIKIEDVKKINAGTAITNDNFDDFLESYRTGYWQKDPDLGEKIFRELWDSGRIYQPRLEGFEAPNPSYGYWEEVKDIEDIGTKVFLLECNGLTEMRRSEWELREYTITEIRNTPGCLNYIAVYSDDIPYNEDEPGFNPSLNIFPDSFVLSRGDIWRFGTKPNGNTGVVR